MNSGPKKYNKKNFHKQKFNHLKIKDNNQWIKSRNYQKINSNSQTQKELIKRNKEIAIEMDDEYSTYDEPITKLEDELPHSFQNHGLISHNVNGQFIDKLISDHGPRSLIIFIVNGECNSLFYL
jgi:hypothetical protein